MGGDIKPKIFNIKCQVDTNGLGPSVKDVIILLRTILDNNQS